MNHPYTSLPAAALLAALLAGVAPAHAQGPVELPVFDDERAFERMWSAVENGEYDTLRALVTSNPRAIDRKEGILLKWALQHVSLDNGTAAVGILLDAGAREDLVESQSNAPDLLRGIFEQVRNARADPGNEALEAWLLDLFKRFIAHGCPADTPESSCGITPLIEACGSNAIRREFIAALLESKTVDVNRRGGTRPGFTPLFYVLTRLQPPGKDDLEIVELLLSRGADLKMTIPPGDCNSKAGATALHLACAAAGDRVDLVTLLLDKGSDPEATTQDGMSPLRLAAMADNAKVCALLLDRGANAASRDAAGIDVIGYCRGEGQTRSPAASRVILGRADGK